MTNHKKGFTPLHVPSPFVIEPQLGNYSLLGLLFSFTTALRGSLVALRVRQWR
jgi:hypothetical protein